MKKLLLAVMMATSVAGFAQTTRTHSRPVTKADIPNQSDAKAKSILDKASEKFRTTPMQVNFSILIHDTKTNKKESIKGNVMMKGVKFKLSANQVDTYYDGKYEYIYNMKNNEVTVTTPTKKDLQEINPAYLLSSYTANCTIQFSTDNKKSDKNYTIDVFPDRSERKDYYKAIVKIEKSTSAVKSVKILSKSGVHSTFYVLKAQKGAKGDAFFTFYPKSHPGVIVNDLR